MRQNFWIIAATMMLSAVTSLFAEDDDAPPAPKRVWNTAAMVNPMVDRPISRPSTTKARRTGLVIEPTPAPESEVISSGVPDQFGNVMTGSGDCYDGCCVGTDVCCDCDCVCDHWIGGVSAYVIKPHWNNGNQAFIRENGNIAGAGNAPVTFNNTNFSWDYQAAPAFWFGYANSCGNGIRAGFFQYNQYTTVSASPAAGQTIIDPFGLGAINTSTPTQVVRATSQLQVNMWDIEGLRRGNNCGWWWMATAGVRYLYLNQGYLGGQFQPTGTAISTITSRHFFNGAGPTMSLQARRAIGERGFGFYGTGRGSLMFGSSNYSFNTPLNRLATNEGTLPLSGNSSGWGVLPVLELEVGFDYRRQLRRSTLVLQAGMVGMAFINAGDATSYNVVSGTGEIGTLGFFGANTSVGLTF